MKIIFIIVAAGQGKRFGLKYNKLFYPLNSKPLICNLLEKLEQIKQINNIILVTDSENQKALKNLVKNNRYKKVLNILKGGVQRQDSVFNALSWIKKNIRNQKLIVAIHDGARLAVSENMINSLINANRTYDAVIPALPVTDTIKSVKKNTVIKTIPRDTLMKISTPQFFHFPLLYQSHVKAKKEGFLGTDDASIIEYNQHEVKIVEGEIENIKLTYMSDLKKIVKEDYRMGQGFDIHKLTPNKKLILGGIPVPYKLGLSGHSDADVLIHAIIDALLGACSLNDIGTHFPDTDKRYKGIASGKLLKETLKLIEQKGFYICNIDSTLFAQKPKLRPFIPKIQKNLCKLININNDMINIKAKTMEKMGAIGREEGIAAQAVVLVKREVLL